MVYRDSCERCHASLTGADEAYVCSYDCTFCGSCAGKSGPRCPNCGGELVRRPRRIVPGSETATVPRARRDERADWTVEQASERDAEALAPLFDAYRQFYRQAPDAETALRFLEERLSRGESTVYFVRGPNGPLGFAQLYPTFSSISCRPMWILNDLFVVPEARHRGVASRLLERAQELARSSRAAAVLLDTATDNPAQHLYEAHGWKLDREFLHYEWTNEPTAR